MVDVDISDEAEFSVVVAGNAVDDSPSICLVEIRVESNDNISNADVETDGIE